MNHQLGMGIIKRIMLVGEIKTKKIVRKTRNNESNEFFFSSIMAFSCVISIGCEIKVEAHGKFRSMEKDYSGFQIINSLNRYEAEDLYDRKSSAIDVTDTFRLAHQRAYTQSSETLVLNCTQKCILFVK